MVHESEVRSHHKTYQIMKIVKIFSRKRLKRWRVPKEQCDLYGGRNEKKFLTGVLSEAPEFRLLFENCLLEGEGRFSKWFKKGWKQRKEAWFLLALTWERRNDPWSTQSGGWEDNACGTDSMACCGGEAENAGRASNADGSSNSMEQLEWRHIISFIAFTMVSRRILNCLKFAFPT